MQQIVITQPGTYMYTLSQEGETVEILGAFPVKNKDVTIHVTLIHQAPHTKGSILLRATVEGQAHVHLSGDIMIEPTAFGAESFLTENILLLSPQSTAEAIPNLEIKNHDVCCSHAATVGQLDPEQLFYLESRGLSPQKAKQLIAQGFLQSVTDKIQKDLC